MRHTYSKWRRSQNKLHAVQSTCLTLAPCVWVSLSLSLCLCASVCVCACVRLCVLTACCSGFMIPYHLAGGLFWQIVQIIVLNLPLRWKITLTWIIYISFCTPLCLPLSFSLPHTDCLPLHTPITSDDDNKCVKQPEGHNRQSRLDSFLKLVCSQNHTRTRQDAYLLKQFR